MRHFIAGFCSYFLATLSLFIYKVLLLLVYPESSAWFQADKPTVTHILLISWFLLGGYKSYMMILWNEAYLYKSGESKQVQNQVINPIKLIKLLIMLPFITIMPFKKEWYKFPS